MKKFYLIFSGFALAFAGFAQVPLSGEGSQASPYLIRTASDWMALATYVKDNKDTFEDKFIRLEEDIDLSSEAFQSLWADNVTYFMGTFDGQGHRVSGIDATLSGTYGGVFGTIGTAGHVTDLTLAGKISSQSVTSGVFAGRSYGTMTRCVNEVTFVSNRPAAGGIVGRAFSGARFIECINKAPVSGMTNVGGIAGTTEMNILFESCGNEAPVSGTGNNIGGIVGMPYPSTFTDCYNKADFNISGTVTYVGGIVGQASWAANAEAEYKFVRCRNEGNLTASRYVAGLVATIGTLAGTVTVDFSDCHNTGDITSTFATSSNYGAAGISCVYVPLSSFTDCSNSGTISSAAVGFNAGIAGGALGTFSATKTAAFVRCSNTGTVSSPVTCSAGIAGVVNGYTSFTDCSNTADISGSSLLGGIVGNLDGLNNSMTGCWNLGNITGTLNRLGGLFGSNTKNGAVIRDCWNAGDVVSTSTATGMAESTGAFAIGGLGGIAAAKFYGCFNLGQVKGITQVGGLVGRPTLHMTGFFQCYNAGPVDAPVDQAGDLVGIDTSDVQKWSVANKAEDCYYIDEFGDNPLDGIGHPVSVAALCKVDLGESFMEPRSCMLPLPSVFSDNDAALLQTAMVIPADGETLDHIMSPFGVGNPRDIKWNCSLPEIVIEDGVAVFKDKVSGPAVLTATLGDYYKEVDITLDVTTGVESLFSGAEIISEKYYDLQGRGLNGRPVAETGIYVVVRKYADGTVRAFRVVSH